MTSSQSTGVPPQPAYIFRGHKSQIHALEFWRTNSRLVSGDADGWVVLWDTTTRRPAASWKAHKSSILSIESWGDDKLITQGRDEAIRVWQITPESEFSLSKALPTESTDFDSRDPWLLHSLKAYTVSFCSISTCPDLQPSLSLLIASPSQKLGQTEIFRLPEESKPYLVPSSPVPGMKPSMTMALKLFRLADDSLCLISANESGFVTLQVLSSDTGFWSTTYASQSHSQPILGIDVAPTLGYFFTSAADAVIARYKLPRSASESPTDDDRKIIKTGHAGQQDLKVRSDEKVFATAGWDSKMRVYSSKSMAELAVLKWHKEASYSIAFAEVLKYGEGQTSKDPKLLISTPDDKEAIPVSSDQSMIPINESTTQITPITARQRREWKSKNTHWLAAGSKDGKISLWDIF